MAHRLVATTLAMAVLAALVLVIGGLASARDSTTDSSSYVRVLRGSGKRVVTVAITRRDPVVVTGVHTGSSNFIVHVVRGGDTNYVFNEIGRYQGQAVVDEATPGRYRVVVDADGSWTLKFAQGLRPSRPIPGLFTGAGSRVIPVRVTRDLQPVVTGRHAGRGNFIVHLVGYGRNYGDEEYVFNEIGRFRGQTLIEDLLQGTHYLAVTADGTWSLRFSP